MEEAQAGIKIAGRNINNLRYADDTTLVAESEEERKSLLGKPRGKDSRENHRSFDPRSRMRDTAATALEESASACIFLRLVLWLIF